MKLSIIIPTIGRVTLKDVLNKLITIQQINNYNLEILVIFDGKISQNFHQLVAEFKNIKFIKISATGQKVFASGARNIGLDLSTGDIISFLGDDTIPDENWLKYQFDFHQKNTSKKVALLGRVFWTKKLAQDRFHQFLDNGVQFNFSVLDAGLQPNWQYFYTSNISFKKSILYDKNKNLAKFSLAFSGWGFEDSEFGYRLAKKGLKITYDKNCIVFHDDPQDLVGLLKRTKQARLNALVFEQLHPEIKIIPKNLKLIILKILIIFAKIGGYFKIELKWWSLWKSAWISQK